MDPAGARQFRSAMRALCRLLVVFSGLLIGQFYVDSSANTNSDGNIPIPSREAVDIYNLGVDLARQGLYENAMDSYFKAIAVDGTFAEAHQNVAIFLESQNDIDRAVHHTLMSVKYSRNAEFRARSLKNIVNLMDRQHLIDRNSSLMTQVRDYLDEALESDAFSDYLSDLFHSAAVVYKNLGDHSKALEYYSRALAHDPKYTLSLFGAGNIHFVARNYSAAASYYFRCLNVLPESDHINRMQVLNNLGMISRETSRLDQSLQFFRQAYAAVGADEANKDSDLALLRNWTLTNVFTVMGLVCYWQDFELFELGVYDYAKAVRQVTEMTPAMDPYTFSLLRYASAADDLDNNQKCCSEYNSILGGISDHMFFFERTLRVGYLSYDWRDHPMGRLTKQLVTSHSLDIDSVSFSYGFDDHSDIRQYVSSHSKFVDIAAVRSNREAAKLLDSYSLDILVDLTGHTYNNRLEISTYKPSAVAINFLGFPGSTGCRAFDYSMVHSSIVPPELSSDLFSEKLIYLPHTYQTNSMPVDLPLCADRKHCRQDPSSAVADLSDDQIVFCSFNSNKKLEPIAWTSWMNIMVRLPQSVLLLLHESSSKPKLLAEALMRGISSNRLRFLESLSWVEHLKRISVCEIVLDTFVYGAHTTASDVLWMGVPLLALNGYGSERMPSRVAGSLIRSLWKGNNDVVNADYDPSALLLFDSIRDFEDAAVRLAARRRMMHRFQSDIVDRALLGPTFDADLLEDDIERAYFAVANVWRLQHHSSTNNTVKLGRYHIVVASSRSKKSWAAESHVAAAASTKIDSADIMERCQGSVICIKSVTQALTTDQPALLRRTPKFFRRFMANSPPQIQNDNDCRKLLTDFISHHFDSSGVPLIAELVSACLKNASELSTATAALNVAVDIQYLLEQSGHCDIARAFGDALFNDLFAPVEIETLHQYADCKVPAFASATGKFLVPARCYLPSASPVVSVSASASWKPSSLTNLVGLRLDGHWRVADSLRRFLVDQRHDNTFVVDTKCEPNDVIASTVHCKAGDERYHLIKDIAMFAHNYVVCAADEFRSIQCSNSWLRSVLYASYWLDPSPDRLLALGKVLETSKSSEGALRSIGVAAIAESTIIQHQTRPSSNIITCEEDIFRNDGFVVVIYCYEYGNAWWPRWGPSAAGVGGLGGSEEAVLYLSEQLALLGVTVLVYADPPDEDIFSCSRSALKRCEDGCVVWLPHTAFDMHRRVDVFIAWRYAASIVLGVAAAKRYLWLHDIVPPSTIWESRFLLDGVFVQSDFHARVMQAKLLTWSGRGLDMAQMPRAPLFSVVPNGITDMSECSQEAHNSSVFVYASSPVRGLERVLQSWSQIRNRLPSAVLKVFYGFSPAVQRQLRQLLGADFDTWMTRMQELLTQDGVEFVGAVSHGRLNAELASAGFILYPTSFSETGCITLMRAMACGVIPITSKLVESVLPSLTGEYDLGPAVPLTMAKRGEDDAGFEAYYHTWVQKQWLPSVLSAIDLAEHKPSALDDRRRKMRVHARLNFSWTRSAETMLDVIT